jgi:hypothetical protein
MKSHGVLVYCSGGAGEASSSAAMSENEDYDDVVGIETRTLNFEGQTTVEAATTSMKMELQLPSIVERVGKSSLTSVSMG